MSNEKVLVVEDDLDLAGIMRDYLNKEGYEVRHAHDGVTALSLAHSFDPALIVLDIMLPKLDGIEVCRQIRQTSFAPIIVISAKSSDVDKLVSLGVGADDYLTKPFSLIELVARVKSHIRRYVAFSTQPAEAGARPLPAAHFLSIRHLLRPPLGAKHFHSQRKNSVYSNTSALILPRSFPGNNCLPQSGVRQIIWTIIR